MTEHAVQPIDLVPPPWRSMETAPRDGTPILLFASNGDYEIGHWHGVIQCWVSKRGFLVEAVRWSPLPAPPDAEHCRSKR